MISKHEKILKNIFIFLILILISHFILHTLLIPLIIIKIYSLIEVLKIFKVKIVTFFLLLRYIKA